MGIERNATFERVIPHTHLILGTTHPSDLNTMMIKMGPCLSFIREIYQNLLEIVKAFMEREQDLKEALLLASRDQPLINCCYMDSLCGNGRSPQVTRWRPKAYKETNNLLGYVYMAIRDDLFAAKQESEMN